MSKTKGPSSIGRSSKAGVRAMNNQPFRYRHSSSTETRPRDTSLTWSTNLQSIFHCFIFEKVDQSTSAKEKLRLDGVCKKKKKSHTVYSTNLLKTKTSVTSPQEEK